MNSSWGCKLWSTHRIHTTSCSLFEISVVSSTQEDIDLITWRRTWRAIVLNKSFCISGDVHLSVFFLYPGIIFTSYCGFISWKKFDGLCLWIHMPSQREALPCLIFENTFKRHCFFFLKTIWHTFCHILCRRRQRDLQIGCHTFAIHEANKIIKK